jgi:hypothetical protein
VCKLVIVEFFCILNIRMSGFEIICYNGNREVEQSVKVRMNSRR